MIGVGFLLSCGVLSEDTGCSIGSEGCDCTHGDGCDGTLTCVDGTCESAGWVPDGLSIPEFYDDVAFDWESNRLYAIYDQTEFWDGDVVVALDLDDESGKSFSAFPTDLRVEQVAHAAGLGGVAISLSPSTWETDDAGFGYVAFVDDAGIGAPVKVGVDPGHIAVDAAGNAYVTARESQMPPAGANLFTGDAWSADSYVFSADVGLDIHPDGDHVYVADERGVARWDVTPYGLEAADIYGELPWDEDCRMRDLRVNPDGRSIWTDCGDVLLSADDPYADGAWVANLGVELDDLDFQPDGSHLFAVPSDEGTTVLVFDGSSMQLTDEIEVATRPRRVLAGDDRLVVVRDSDGSGTAAVDVIPYPSPFE
jgi:hypothetical protein